MCADATPLTSGTLDADDRGGNGVSVGFAQESETGVVLTLQVADLQATIDAAVEHGAAPLSPPVDVPGIGVVASFRDPEGQPVMLVPANSAAQG